MVRRVAIACGGGCRITACESIFDHVAGGAMNTRDHLDSYIKHLQRRLRIGAVLRGSAVFVSVARAVTVILVLLANHFAFASWTLTSSRVVLLVSLALAIGFGLAVPLYGMSPRRTATKAETAFPQFEQRLVTFAERDAAKKEPFIELLAADTLHISQPAHPPPPLPTTPPPPSPPLSP